MVNPINSDKNHLQGAMGEIASSMSSLNMEPLPIKNPDKDAMFLSELDKWAQHSMEHLLQAAQEIGKARQKLEKVKATLIGVYEKDSDPKKIVKKALDMLQEL